jgi:hypothetical protein
MQFRLRSARGISLAEAIVACFVMTAAMVVSAALYNSALMHSVRIDRMHRAAQAVDRRIEEIRAWSREQHGTNGPDEFTSGWSAYDNVETVDPEYPEFTIITRVTARDLFSPSSAFEDKAFAAQADETVPQELKSQRRQLNNSSYMLEVEGRWGEGPRDAFVARTLIADPVKDYGWEPDEAYRAIELSSTPSSMAPEASIFITAAVKDANGAVVRNAVVQWYVDPKSTGNGTLRVDPRRPERCEFINQVRVEKNPDDPDDVIEVYTGGYVRVVARVRLGGVEAINKTNPIRLDAPPE